MMVTSYYKYYVFPKNPNYICTNPEQKYRQKAPKLVEIAETSRYTPVFWAVRFNPISVPVQALEQNIPAVLASTVRNRLPWLHMRCDVVQCGLEFRQNYNRTTAHF